VLLPLYLVDAFAAAPALVHSGVEGMRLWLLRTARLGKRRLFARQISFRGGELWCQDREAAWESAAGQYNTWRDASRFRKSCNYLTIRGICEI